MTKSQPQGAVKLQFSSSWWNFRVSLPHITFIWEHHPLLRDWLINKFARVVPEDHHYRLVAEN